ncbi:hypothetical protein Tco_0603465 [Tanacetum coccineum]
MSSATSAVTYTSVYTNSEPGRAFWGADDEEVSEGGILRIIVLGYDGLPLQPVALLSPDYIPGTEDPQTPLVPQDEDEHEFSAEEKPLPPVDSPTAESPGHVTESDPEEDPEEYEDDETEDGPVDYPMDGGDDGDDDDGDSSGDNTNEDEDDEDDEEEEEGHIAPANSTIAAPVDEPVFPPERIKPVIPPPSTDITIGARITALLGASFHLAHYSPLITIIGCPTKSRPLQDSLPIGFIDAVTAALPSPLPPPSLYIPPPVDRRDDIPESEQPPLKRLYLSTDVGLVLLSLEDAQDSRHSSGASRPIVINVYAHEDPKFQAHQDKTATACRVLTFRHSHQSSKRRARQPGPEARIPDHQDASGDADSHI